MHELHFAIGELLKNIKLPQTQVLLDGACGGHRHIRLYGEEPPTGGTCLVWVDAAIVLAGEIRIVLEIEESNIRPLNFCGKFLATALSHYHNGPYGRFPIASEVLFIQIFEKRQNSEGWSKYKQCLYLEREIKERILTGQTRIKDYSFHYGTVEEFRSPEHREALLNEIFDFLARVSVPSPNC